MGNSVYLSVQGLSDNILIIVFISKRADFVTKTTVLYTFFTPGGIILPKTIELHGQQVFRTDRCTDTTPDTQVIFYDCRNHIGGHECHAAVIFGIWLLNLCRSDLLKPRYRQDAKGIPPEK
jgi:hypothetical protein